MTARSCLLLCALAGLAFGATRVAAAPPGSPWGADYFPNIALVNQDGKAVRFYDDLIKGKVVVVNFIFTSCTDSCPLETAKLRQVQAQLGDRVGRDVFMYSISIDPARDTPEALKAYAAKFKVGPGWQFLTGKADEIRQLQKKLGLYRDGEQRKDHTASLIIGNETTGRWIKRSTFDNPKVLAAVIGERLFNYSRPVDRKSYAEAPRIRELDPGEDLFRRRCQACHTVGKGDTVGPDLLGVVARRDRGWLARWLMVPDEMLAEKDPVALELFDRFKQVPMPNLRLTAREAETLIGYMDAASRRVEQAKAPAKNRSCHEEHAEPVPASSPGAR